MTSAHNAPASKPPKQDESFANRLVFVKLPVLKHLSFQET